VNRKMIIGNAGTTLRRRFVGSLRALSGLAIAVAMSQSLIAQTTPNPSSTVDVTSDPTTWLQESGNAINIPAGADGVTVNNGAGGVISSANATAIETSADTTINNAGTTSGGFNGVNFVNGSGSGVLNNTATGSITSDSRAVNIGGAVQLTNQGDILGTGDQRNGTVYSDSVANNFSIDNSGTIDAGAGNQGSAVALEIGPTTTATDTSTGEIRSESQSGTIAGLRVADGIGFQGELDNDGLIEGAQNGLYFGNADHTGGEDWKSTTLVTSWEQETSVTELFTLTVLRMISHSTTKLTVLLTLALATQVLALVPKSVELLTVRTLSH